MVIKQASVDIGFIRARLQVWRKRLDARFTPMSELTLDDLVGLTGLDTAEANLARQREGSEPLLWHGDEASLQMFRLALEGDGLQLTQGGRFCHVMGSASDKGSAVTWLIGRFKALRGREPLSIGLGDGPNDVSMLNAVDQAVVIRGHHDLTVEPTNPHLYRTRAPGPEGWVEGMSHWWGDVLTPPGPCDAMEANA